MNSSPRTAKTDRVRNGYISSATFFLKKFLSHSLLLSRRIYHMISDLLSAIIDCTFGFLQRRVLYYSPLWAPLLILYYAPAIASYYAFEVSSFILTTLAATYLLTPQSNVITGFVKNLRAAISYITCYKKDHWLAEHGVKNLREYYDKLQKDGAGVTLNYDNWRKKHNKSASYYAWKNWHYEQEVFKNPDITLKDTMVDTINHYGDPIQAHVYHLKNKRPRHNPNSNKHLVMFLGRQLSAESRLDEMLMFAESTGMHIHMFNYPSVNDATGKPYTEKDLQKCGSAVVEMLLKKSKHFPDGIPAHNILLYGNCLGSIVAEMTYQDLLSKGIQVARRILSNNYGVFRAGVRTLFLHQCKCLVESLTSGLQSYPLLRRLLSATIYGLASPIILIAFLVVGLAPFFNFGWQFSPFHTAKGQDHDCLLLGRADEGVLKRTRHIDYLRENKKPGAIQTLCQKIAAHMTQGSAQAPESKERVKFHTRLSQILQSSGLSLQQLWQEAQANRQDTSGHKRPTSVVALLKQKVPTAAITRPFAEYIVFKTLGLFDNHGNLSSKHALVRYHDALRAQIHSQEMALTEHTKKNTGRMNSIINEPHMGDFFDMAPVDPQTKKVGAHDDGKAIYQQLANTTLPDMVYAQKAIKGAWRCSLFRRNLSKSVDMQKIREKRKRLSSPKS